MEIQSKKGGLLYVLRNSFYFLFVKIKKLFKHELNKPVLDYSLNKIETEKIVKSTQPKNKLDITKTSSDDLPRDFSKEIEAVKSYESQTQEISSYQEVEEAPNTIEGVNFATKVGVSTIPEVVEDNEDNKEQESDQHFTNVISSPRRSRSPSFQSNDSQKTLDNNLNLTEVEGDDSSTESEEIDLAGSTSRHIKLQRTLRTQQNNEVSEVEQNVKNARIKRRPKVMFNLEMGQMIFKLPIISFPRYEIFKNSRPISCLLNISDIQENNKIKKIELTEQNCNIEKYIETPVYMNLDLFRNINCNIKTPNKDLIRNYNYHHENENFYIFLQKDDKNILLYKTQKFFKESDKFWILLKKNLKLTPNPTSILDNLIYHDYRAYHVGYTSDNYDIQIFDENNNLLFSLFKEPKISFSAIDNNCIFDEFYHKEPLFSANFNILLDCSNQLRNYPKLIHIQNPIVNGSEKPENFYKRIEWKQGDEFEITPEHLDNKIGNYQIDIEFYQDESYNEKLFCESIRGFFRYCPISIENNNLLIFPSNDDKEDFEISICSLNEQLLSIECSEIEFISKFVENRINWLALVPKNLDQFEIVFKSVNSENSVKLRPYIPRLKWRLNNISEFENFSDIALNLDFDEKFYFSKNLTLEIRIISKNAINDLFISYNDNRIPLKISDSNDFIYSFPLNSIYEEINKSIKKGGVSSLFLIIEDEKINLLQISGKLGEFYDHEPPKPRRCMKVNRSKRIGTHRNILTELKNKGYIKSKPKKVVATLISVISDELGLDKMNLFKMIFSDHSLEAKVNQFLSLNNCNLESGMTYGEFLSGLWDKPLNKMLEMILYIEQKK